MPKKAFGENDKKKGGNAQKAEAAAAKAAAEKAKQDAAQAQDWGKGAKNSSKKEAEAAKKAELERKKAEKAALLAEEEKSIKSAPKGKVKAAEKKVTPSRGLDLSQLDAPAAGPAHAISASGIDNALDALTLTTGADTKIDKHPERRFKAAYAAFEERRMREMETDGSGQGLRKNQKEMKIRKEFERSPENPFNQVNVAYDATKDEVREIKEREKRNIEERLAR